jgi:hypothetical protein
MHKTFFIVRPTLLSSDGVHDVFLPLPNDWTLKKKMNLVIKGQKITQSKHLRIMPTANPYGETGVKGDIGNLTKII